MKQTISLVLSLLAVCILLLACGCGEKKPSGSSTTAPNTSHTSETESTSQTTSESESTSDSESTSNGTETSESEDSTGMTDFSDTSVTTESSYEGNLESTFDTVPSPLQRAPWMRAK